MRYLILGVSCQPKPEPQEITFERPNIVLIIADDMNWDDCGAYGHPHIKTPHIDALAAAGMRFDHAYVTASSCSPIRASIITGRYPHNTGAEQLHWALPPGTNTFVEQLKSGGYYTAAAGKWHMGNNIRQHFDSIYEAGTAGFQLPSNSDKEPVKMVAQQPSGCEDWLPALQNRLWISPSSCGLPPWTLTEPMKKTYWKPPTNYLMSVFPLSTDIPEVREDLRQYYDEIARLDSYVGKVVAELEKQGVEEQTLILFISDNGRLFLVTKRLSMKEE